MFILLHLILLISVVSTQDIPNSLTVDASKPVQAVLTTPLYINEIIFSDPSAELNLYAGPITSISSPLLLRKYTVANANSSLPQLIIAPLISFQLSQGTALVKSTRNAIESTWGVARVGRSGFLMTADYPYPANNSTIPYVTFTSGDRSDIQFEYKLVAGSSGMYVASQEKNYVSTYYGHTLAANNIGQSILLNGTSSTVTYSNPSKNNGIYVEFTMRKYVPEATTDPTKEPKAAGFNSFLASLTSLLLILSLSSPFVRNVRKLSVQGIEKSDIVAHDKERDYYLVQMKPRHIPMIMPVLKEFYKTENTGAAYKVKIEDEHVWPCAFNYSRYPFSLFVTDKNGQVLSMGLCDVVYRDPSDDPRPRASPFSKKEDLWMPFLNAMSYGEQRVLEVKPNIGKMIHLAAAWTAPTLRGQQISKFLFQNGFKHVWNQAPAMGYPDMMAVLTSKAQQNHLKTTGWTKIEQLPDHAYAAEGHEIVKIPEGNGVLVYLDLNNYQYSK